MKRNLLGLVCGVTLATAATGGKLPKVALLPYGPVTEADIQKVKSGIEALYEVTVVVLPESPLPRDAYFKPRDRYKADLLLEALEKQKPEEFTKIIGLSARDISVTNDEGNDWGLFGLGHCPENRCLMEDARGKIATVEASTGRPCESCAKRLLEPFQGGDD